VKLLGNLGFYCLIILGEVNMQLSFHFEWFWYIFLFMLNIMKLLAFQTVGVKDLRCYFFSLHLLDFTKVV
jgi:hypothetical protein